MRRAGGRALLVALLVVAGCRGHERQHPRPLIPPGAGTPVPSRSTDAPAAGDEVTGTDLPVPAPGSRTTRAAADDAAAAPAEATDVESGTLPPASVTDDPAPQPAPAGPPAARPGVAPGDRPPVPDADDPSTVTRSPTALAHLRVVELDGLARQQEVVALGVPFGQGTLAGADALSAWWTDDETPLPSQARALSRWPDGSVRWALIDARVDLGARRERLLAVGRAPSRAATPDPWQIEVLEDGGVRVGDGTHQWTVLRPGAAGDEVLGLRARLVDRLGHAYAGRVDPDSFTVLERGPVRLALRLTGANRAVDGDGLPIDFHTFTVHVHLLAGQPLARLEWTLENGPLEDPPGPLAFRSYELLHAPPAAPRRVATLAGSSEQDVPFELVQDGHGGRFSLDGGTLPAGPERDLWGGVLGADGDVWVHRVESAQNHPAALSYQPGAALRVGLLPPGTGETFFLDDATRKTFRLTVAEDAGEAGRALMARAARPLHLALDPLEVLASGAWGDQGRFYLPLPARMTGPVDWPRDPPTGWADWGEAAAHNTHTTGSPRNQLSVFLEAMQSGRADLFRWARSRAWHAMDLRPYHIQGFDADRFPRANLYEGVPHPNEKPALRLGRSEMPDRFPEYKQGLPPGGHGYNGFDPEHMTLDDVYECWLLTGDWLALDALHSAGEAMLTWKELVPDGYIFSSRTFGWTLRALVQVYRATGQERYLDAARRYVARADAERGRGAVKNLRVNAPDPRQMADHPSDAPWMVAIALHGLGAYWDVTHDPIVPPMVIDLTAFCLSAFRGNGFLPALPVDGAPITGQVTSPLGVTTWVPGGLAAGAFVTGDHSPVDRVYGYYALLRRHTSQPIRFGSGDWHWWQLYLASLMQRYGRVAVEDPQHFRPPSKGR